MDQRRICCNRRICQYEQCVESSDLTCRVVFVNDTGETLGTSVTAYSMRVYGESEVLVSKRAKQKLTDIETPTDYTGGTLTIIHCRGV